MRLTTLVVSILCYTLAVSAQDTAADDFYDYYYDDVASEVASTPKDTAIKEMPTGDSVVAGTVNENAEPNGEKNIVPSKDDIIEAPVSDTEPIEEKPKTTAAPPTRRRKLINLKTKHNRQRASRPSRPNTSPPKAQPAAVETATDEESTQAQRGNQRTRNTRLRGRLSTKDTNETPAEKAEVVSPSRRRSRPSTSSQRSTSNGVRSPSRLNSSRKNLRPTNRASINEDDAEGETTGQTSTNRFSSSRSNPRLSGRRRTPTTSASSADEPTSNHRLNLRGRDRTRGSSTLSARRSQESESETTAASDIDLVAEETVDAGTRRSRFGNRARG